MRSRDPRPRTSRRRARLLARAALGLSLVGCASAPVTEARDRYYHLPIPSGFRPTTSDNAAFDAVYRDRDGAIFIGIVTDDEPANLATLDATVRENLKLGAYDQAVVTKTSEDAIDGIDARRSEIFIASGGETFAMVNVHCATEERNVQLVVWGLASKAHRVRALARKLRDGFSFTGEVAPARGSGDMGEDDGQD